jgi:hypothetical protein
MGRQFSHVSGLHRTAQLSPQLMGAGFDHGVMRDADDRPVGPIQGHRHSGSLSKQLIQTFLKRRCRSVHESASVWGQEWGPKVPSGRTLPRNRQVPLLTFCTP